MTAQRRPVPWAALALAAAACVPTLDPETGRIEALRVVAVQAEPPEARPGEAVVLTAQVADATGPRPDAAPSWILCASRKPLSEPGPVDPACLSSRARTLSAGAGESVSVVVPSNACSLFGPDPTPPSPGAPPGRPVDPDPTGGYYQPVVVRAPEGDVAVYGLRVRCPVPGLTLAQQQALRDASPPNRNPRLAGVSIGNALRVGTPAKVEVRWPRCDEGTPCDGAERYAVFDPISREVRPARENLRVSLLVTGGSLEPVTLAPPADAETATFTFTPEAPGRASVFVTLRDDRGGVAVERLDVDVAP